MDSSAFRGLSDGIGSMILWALFGMICAGLLALGAIGAAIWFVFKHIQFV